MYTTDMTRSNYEIKQEQDFLLVQQELLLTSGYYPTTVTTSYIPNYPMSLSSDGYSTSTSHSSPDMMTYTGIQDSDSSCDIYFSSSISSPPWSPIDSSMTQLPVFDFYSLFEPTPTTNVLLPTLPSQTIPATTSTALQLPETIKSQTKKQPKHCKKSITGKPFPCYSCKRAFARKHDLQRHIRVHTGDKPYVCPCCKKAFARTDALKRHWGIEETCRNSQSVQVMKSTTGRKKVKTCL